MEENYKYLCTEPSDINEHLPTLYKYASECNHITECGVRTFVSSYAFGTALQNRENTTLIQVDPNYNQQGHKKFEELCIKSNIKNIFYKQSDLDCPLEKTELLFIDTWHIYGQLKRELTRWNSYVTKYIIMHDTTVDAIYGESIRNGWDAVEQSQKYNIPVEEIKLGLWPAIEEFLQEHKEWILQERYDNNNGLTVLRRV